MEDVRRRSESLLALQREFSSARLEEQILRRAFELVIPVLATQAKQSNPPHNTADRAPQSQGA